MDSTAGLTPDQHRARAHLMLLCLAAYDAAARQTGVSVQSIELYAPSGNNERMVVLLGDKPRPIISAAEAQQLLVGMGADPAHLIWDRSGELTRGRGYVAVGFLINGDPIEFCIDYASATPLGDNDPADLIIGPPPGTINAVVTVAL